MSDRSAEMSLGTGMASEVASSWRKELRMVFRIKEFDEQRGFTKYFWKGAPATGGPEVAATGGQ